MGLSGFIELKNALMEDGHNQFKVLNIDNLQLETPAAVTFHSSRPMYFLPFKGSQAPDLIISSNSKTIQIDHLFILQQKSRAIVPGLFDSSKNEKIYRET